MSRPRSHTVLYSGITLFLLLAGAGPRLGPGLQQTVAAQAGTSGTAVSEWRPGQQSPDGIWRVDLDRVLGGPSAAATPVHAVLLELATLEAALDVATNSPGTGATIYLPSPSGSFQLFRVEYSSVMEPALEAAHPEIRTFTAQGITDGTSSGRISLTPAGFHALIVSATGAAQVIEKTTGDAYVVYSSADQAARQATSECRAPHPQNQPAVRDGLLGQLGMPASIGIQSSGATLRTFRIAIGATGEFTQRFGAGTVPGALAAITAGINAANAMLEKEAAIRLVLIAGEESIIYTDPGTDGYTSHDLPTMAEENHAKLTTVIGAANYDLGHVFDGGEGLAAQGYAFFGVCVADWKDKAGTIFWGVLPSHPVGLGTFLHELGHQFTAYHSFNGTTDSCFWSRNPEGAYEPGSGSSIMSYSGLCGAENVPATSLYNAGALDQIINYTTAGLGGTCAAPSATGNNPPLVSAGSDYTIPAGTPFALTAVGSDIDGDPVTYSWEQYDLGAASPPTTDDGTRPLFRIYNPTTSPSRTFPELPYILAGTTAVGQTLPTTNRVLTFRVVARDNRAGGGGVSTDDAVLTVHASAGPFAVTAPNTPVSWISGSTQTVTWNPAGTALAPVSTANVRILLSTDNGQTFPTVLAASTPNDGSQAITVPGVTTSTARVKVEALGNVYFDISNAAFTIGPAGVPPNLVVKSVSGGGVTAGAAATIKDTTLNSGAGAAVASQTRFYFSSDKTYDAGDTLLNPATGRAVPALAAGASSKGSTSVTIPAVAPGIYYLFAVADAGNANTESSETDNTKMSTLTVGPDLAVKKLTLSSSTVAPGGSTTVTLQTTNKSKATAGASVSKVYYSADKKLNVGSDTLLTTINVAALNGGQTSSDVRLVTIPAGAAPGTRYIIAVVDADGQVAEANEAKNTKAVKITVP